VPIDRPELLATYLNDHLAGSTGGLEKAKRAAKANRGDRIRRAAGGVARRDRERPGQPQPMDGASELLRELHEDGAAVVLASSAKENEVDRYLDLLDARELVDSWTSAADVEQTKPEPDLIEVALKKAGSSDAAVMVGDSTWDVKAAAATGVPTLAVLTGGFSAGELREAGAAQVVESIGALRKDRGALAEIALG